MNNISDRIPSALKAAKAWLVWRLEQKPGEQKPRKVPYYATNGKPRGAHGTAEDIANLTTFDRAVAASGKRDFAGIGFATLADFGILALDFDNVVTDGEILPAVREVCEGTYFEFSPSGKGVRAFFTGTLPNKKDHNRNGSKLFAVEFFGESGFVTVTGNVAPDCALWGYDDIVTPISPAVNALFEERFGPVRASSAPVDDDDEWLLSAGPRGKLSHDEIRAGLELLDPDCDYHAWLEIMQSLHYDSDGDPDVLDTVRAWSSKSSQYPGDRALAAKWDSFGKNRGRQLTGAVFIKRVNDARGEQAGPALDGYLQQIKDATDSAILRDTVCAEIRKDIALGAMERENLAHTLKARLKELDGVPYSIDVIRKLLARPHGKKKHKMPDWAEGWIYVTDRDSFLRKGSDEWLTPQSFNAKFNHLVPRDENNHIIMTATAYATNELAIPTARRAMYLPTADETFEHDGSLVVNSFRARSVPEESEKIRPGGQRAINALLRHIGFLMGGQQERVDTLLSWMAFCTQNMGRKILWAPLIKGIPGDGKTLLGRVMSSVLGQSNVTQVSPKVLHTDFNGWAEGHCLAILEELKMAGHNRHDALNALKPIITNDTVPIHRKGVDEYSVINTTNVMAFTNFTDALPVDDLDRRWWIVFTPFKDIASFASTVGESPDAYFDKLFTLLQDADNLADIRRWLLDYKLPGGFSPHGRAPDTYEKDAMASASTSDNEALLADIIARGGVGITPDCVVSRCAAHELRMCDESEKFSNWDFNKMMLNIGFYSIKSRRFWWNRKTEIVWFRNGTKLVGMWEGSEQINKLNQTLVEDAFFD